MMFIYRREFCFELHDEFSRPLRPAIEPKVSLSQIFEYFSKVSFPPIFSYQTSTVEYRRRQLTIEHRLPTNHYRISSTDCQPPTTDYPQSFTSKYYSNYAVNYSR